MIDKICETLTNKIKIENPDIDEERAEIINYGLHLIIGEIPKFFIIIAIAFLLGVGKLTIITYFLILPYRAFSGGFHLKTHIGCIVGTTIFFCGIAYLSKYLVLEGATKYLITSLVWIFGVIMITKYAPADTENVPILSKKERKQKKILSYIALTISILVSIIIKNEVISNILVYGMLMQSISITKLAYKLTNNKYGYELYKI